MITFVINDNKDIGLYLDASVKKPFPYIGFSFILLESGNVSEEVIQRLHKQVINLAKTFAPSFEKQPDRLSKPPALDTLVFFKIVEMVFLETAAILKESL